MISKQAALRSVIWSDVHSVEKPGIFLAKSTIRTMPADDNSVIFSHRKTPEESGASLSHLMSCGENL